MDNGEGIMERGKRVIPRLTNCKVYAMVSKATLCQNRGAKNEEWLIPKKQLKKMGKH